MRHSKALAAALLLASWLAAQPVTARRGLRAAPAPAPAPAPSPSNPLDLPSGGGSVDAQCAVNSALLPTAGPVTAAAVIGTLFACSAQPDTCPDVTVNATAVRIAAQALLMVGMLVRAAACDASAMATRLAQTQSRLPCCSCSPWRHQAR